MRRLLVIVGIFLCPVALFLFVPRVSDGKATPKGLPPWFAQLDTDKDGQISLAEWLRGKRDPDEFRLYDLDHNAHLSPLEALRMVKDESHLVLVKGQATYKGVLNFSNTDFYRDKRSFKALTVQLERGKKYQFDQINQGTYAHLYLEGPDGELLAQHAVVNSVSARIIYRPTKSGTYRVIATSIWGWQNNPFTLNVRALVGPDALPKGLPAWFAKLDQDEDGQISLPEWRRGGKPPEEFIKLDHNQDGFLTPEEVLSGANDGNHLKLVKGQAEHKGTLETSLTEVYQFKRAFKPLSVRLQGGKTYRFEMTSQMYYSHLYLEGPDGKLLAQNAWGGWGGGMTVHLVHRATRSGNYRLICTSQGGFSTGPFSLTVREGAAALERKGLPTWFGSLDKDGDGQVSLAEWLQGGRKREDFREHDLDQDGFITAVEALRNGKEGARLELVKGRLDYKGTVEMSTTEMYQFKRAFKSLSIRLEAGKTYQIEMVSPVYYAYLYLESPDGKLLAQHDSGGNGLTARIIHRAAKAGTYRIIATSLGGFRTGAFSLTVRTTTGTGAGPKGAPPWFGELDADGDGQISLAEWLEGGWGRDDFLTFDRDRDGFITPREARGGR